MCICLKHTILITEIISVSGGGASCIPSVSKQRYYICLLRITYAVLCCAVIGLLDRYKLFLSLLLFVSRVLVWVPSQSRFLVGFLELCLSGIFANAQGLIVVLFGFGRGEAQAARGPEDETKSAQEAGRRHFAPQRQRSDRTLRLLQK